MLLLLCSSFLAHAQNDEVINTQIKEIYRQVLTEGKSYDWLNHLTNQIGGRLSGSLNAERAIKWAKDELDALQLDSVWLQTVMVPKWVRGTFEYANIESSPGNTINVSICALELGATPLQEFVLMWLKSKKLKILLYWVKIKLRVRLFLIAQWNQV